MCNRWRSAVDVVVVFTAAVALATCAESLTAPADAPAGDHYVAVQAGRMSLRAAIDATKGNAVAGRPVSAQHLVESTWRFGSTDVIAWVGPVDRGDGTFAQSCVEAIPESGSGRTTVCEGLGELLGIPNVTQNERTVEGTVVNQLLIDGASGVVAWISVTTESGDTVVAQVINGVSYVEWSLADPGDAVSISVLKSDHAEFWSESAHAGWRNDGFHECVERPGLSNC